MEYAIYSFVFFFAYTLFKWKFFDLLKDAFVASSFLGSAIALTATALLCLAMLKCYDIATILLNVTINVVWIANWFYYTLTPTNHN
jgi:hypothetical protein